MFRKWIPCLLSGLLAVTCWDALKTPARAQSFDPSRYFHYPYYYFPHNYWPQLGPKWPEPPGSPYMPAPAYMAFPPFREPHWRYEWWEPQFYYRGFHFWLDQF
jgi:hypothetical protein